MVLLLMLLGAALLLVLAGYAQYRIPFHTAGRANVALLRGALAAGGLVLGAIAAASSSASGGNALLAFLGGFGLVHAPAAIILHIKRLRGAGRS